MELAKVLPFPNKREEVEENLSCMDILEQIRLNKLKRMKQNEQRKKDNLDVLSKYVPNAGKKRE